MQSENTKTKLLPENSASSSSACQSYTRPRWAGRELFFCRLAVNQANVDLGEKERSPESAAQVEKKCVFRFNHQKSQVKKENLVCSVCLLLQLH